MNDEQPTTIGQAIDDLDIEARAGEDIILVNIVGGKPRHSVVTNALRGKPLAPDTYLATGRFVAGTVGVRGRKDENVASVFALAIDSDLKDNLGMTLDEVLALDGEVLQAKLTAHLAEIVRVCKATGLLSNYVVGTGHGYALWYMLVDEDQANVERARTIYKRLVAALNRAAGWRIADPAVSDAGTRIMRLPGAPNTKGGTPRDTALMHGTPEFWTLDALEAKVAAIEPAIDEPAERPAVKPATSSTSLVSAFDLDGAAASEIIGLVAPYWSSGQRHALALGLAGWLKRNGVSKSMTLSIIDGCAGSDPERDDRIKAVDTTYARSDSAVVGWTAIRELLPPLTVRRIDDLLSAFWRAQQRALAPAEVEVVMSGSSTLTDIRDRAEVVNDAEAEVDDEDENRVAIEFDPLPPEVLQGAVAEYVEIMRPTTEAPIQYHVGAFLAVNGALAGRAAYTPYASKVVYANQYVMLVGSTGTSKKDTAINRSTKTFAQLPITVPLRGVPTGGARWSKLQDAGSDVALLKHLRDNPNTLLVVPELHAQIAKMRRKGTEALFDLMLTLWDANDRYENKTIANDIEVNNPTLSILAAIQPARLRNSMNEEILSSGFINRWLIIPGEAPAPISDPPTVNLDAARALLTEIVSRYDDLETIAAGSGPVAIPFSPDCADAWRKYYERNWYASKRDPEAGEFMSRYPDLVRKVALTYALTDLSRMTPREIEWRHVRAAISLIEWQAKQLKKLTSEWGGSDETRIEARIVAALGNPKHTRDDDGNHIAVSSRKLKQLTYIKGVPTSIWNRALGSLVKSGEVAECYPSGGYELGRIAEDRKRKATV